MHREGSWWELLLPTSCHLGTPQSLESQLPLAVCGRLVPGSSMESQSEDAKDPDCLRRVICM